MLKPEIKTKHDVVRYMKRFPDNIIDKSQRMTAKIWKCSECQTEYKSDIEITIPIPCNVCGGIFFEKIKEQEIIN